MDAPCCPPTADNTLEETAHLYAASDPTLASCCLREQQQQRYAAKLRGQLLEHDPTNVRQHMALNTIVTPPLDDSASTASRESWEDDDDNDPALAQLRALRLHELQRGAQQRSNTTAGVHDIPPSQLLERIQSSSGTVLCHLSQPSDAVSQEVDEAVVILASQWRDDVPCWRVDLRKAPDAGRRVCRALGVHVAGLVLIEDGEVLDRRSVDAFVVDGAFEEQRLRRWLRRLLPNQPWAEGESSEEEEEEGEACGQCGRTYPHTHVRNIRALCDDDDHE